MRGETEVVVLMQKCNRNSRKRAQRTQKNGEMSCYLMTRTSLPEVATNPRMVPEQNAVVNPGSALEVPGRIEEVG